MEEPLSGDFKPKDYTVLSNKLHEQTENGDSCDVKLVFQGCNLWAHSCVLSAGSKYFEVLLNNKFAPVDKENIDLSEVVRTVESAKEVHSFIYLSKVTVTEKNYEDLLQAGSFLLIQDLVSAVEQFLLNILSVKNSLALFCVAQHFSLKELSERSSRFISGRLTDLYPFHGLINNVKLEELECLFDTSVIASSPPAGLAQLALSWFQLNRDENLASTKDLLKRIKGSSFGIQAVAAKASHQEKDLLDGLEDRLKPASCGSSDKEEAVLCVRLQREDTSYTASNYCCFTNVFIRSTNEWLRLPSFTVPVSNLQNGAHLTTPLSLYPIGADDNLVILRFPVSGYTYILLYDLQSQNISSFPAGPAGYRACYLLQGNLLVVASTVPMRGKRDDRVVQISKMDTKQPGTWKSVTKVALNDRTLVDSVELLHLRSGTNDRHVVLFQIRTEGLVPLYGSNRKTRIFCHQINLRNGGKRSLSSHGTKDSFSCPSLEAQDLPDEVRFICQRSPYRTHWSLTYNLQSKTWVETEDAKCHTQVLDLLSSARSAVNSRMNVSLPGATYRVSQTTEGFCSSLVRYDISSDTGEVLAPPPLVPDFPSWCGVAGLIKIGSLPSFAPALSVIENFRASECGTMFLTPLYARSQSFYSSGLVFDTNRPQPEVEETDSECDFDGNSSSYDSDDDEHSTENECSIM